MPSARVSYQTPINFRATLDLKAFRSKTCTSVLIVSNFPESLHLFQTYQNDKPENLKIISEHLTYQQIPLKQHIRTDPQKLYHPLNPSVTPPKTQISKTLRTRPDRSLIYTRSVSGLLLLPLPRPRQTSYSRAPAPSGVTLPAAGGGAMLDAGWCGARVGLPRAPRVRRAI